MEQLCPLQPLASLIAACEQVHAGREVSNEEVIVEKGQGREVNDCLASGFKEDVPSSHFEHGNQGSRVAAWEGAD